MLKMSLTAPIAILVVLASALPASSQAAGSLYESDKFEADNYPPEGNASPLVDQRKITRACIGEKNCPVAVQSMFPCGYTEIRAGAELCTVYKGGGTKVVLDYTIEHQGTHEGNKCGYSWFLVTCYLPK
jgi:hypothetical protein